MCVQLDAAGGPRCHLQRPSGSVGYRVLQRSVESRHQRNRARHGLSEAVDRAERDHDSGVLELGDGECG